MKFTRVLTAHKPVDADFASWISWKTVDAVISAGDGSVIFEQRGVEVPQQWSQNAANILAQKYLRKAGVPSRTISCAEGDMPSFLWRRQVLQGRSDVTYGGETSARQVFHRMAGCWAYWGWRERLITTEEDARVFYDEVFASLALQYAAPNSPQWFNTGLYWAYGIEGPDSGQWYVDEQYPIANGGPSSFRIHNSYERPQPHACFIQTVEDDLVNPGGMMDLWTREARLFKHGSGSGSNMSRIRAKGEGLSGGGISSGLMSFLRVGDRSAGSIKSGGTTRRAALMRVLDVDHPEIEDFIQWKAVEEHKAACIAVGSRVICDRLEDVARTRSVPRGFGVGRMEAAQRMGIPQSLLDRARMGEVDWPVYAADSYEGPAIETVSGQNSNNSVRISGEFLRRVDAGEVHDLTARTSGEVVRTVGARDLWNQLCRAAWASGDPGIQLDDVWNEWHTCAADGRINATNPCSEYGFLDDTACNLASIRLTRFLSLDAAALDKFEHVVRVWTVVLEISVYMASFPSEAIARNSYLYRTLGLGYADLGGLLMRLALPYASDEGRALAAGLTALMTGVAYRASADMAEEVGAFARWEANRVPFLRVMQKHREAVGGISCVGLAGAIVVRAEKHWGQITARSFRNAQVTLLAPTGTISFVMDCDTTGVEPDFALVKHKSLAGGGSMRIVNQAVPEALRRLGYHEVDVQMMLASLEQCGVLPTRDDDRRSVGTPYLPDDSLAIFACAGDIAPEDHVRMVAAVQPFLSGGVSKTVNLPRDATVDDVDRVYRLAASLGVKSVAVYRDGSKLSQPLSAGGSHEFREADPGPLQADAPAPLARGEREYLAWRRNSVWKQKIKIGDHGQTVYLDVSEYPDGRPGEMFLEIAGQGSTLRSLADCLAIAISLGLQYGVPVEKFVDKFVGTKFEPAGYVEGHDRIRFASSIADYIARELGITYAGRDDLANAPAPIAEAITRIAEVSEHLVLADPNWLASAGQLVAHESPAQRGVRDGAASWQPTGDPCPQCGEMLRRSGTCRTCPSCGYDEGCGG